MSKTQLSIRSLQPVGGEIVGLVAGSEANAEVRAALYDAWLQHGFLLFRNVESIAQHVALSQCFGELEIHPVPEARAEEHPLLMELGGKKTSNAFVYDGVDVRVNRIPWHRDGAYTPDICKGAMLRMLEIPAAEGETLLADTARAYDDLPADVKTRLQHLEYKATLRDGAVDMTRQGAIWTTAREATEQEDPGGVKRRVVRALKYPSVIQPALLVHPESRRGCLFLSLNHVDYFLGMEKAESDELLAYLAAHMTQPHYIYKHRWSVNDAIVWDNRRLMHAATGNKPGDRRRGLRTTLAGGLHLGRYFDPNAQRPAVAAIMD